MKKFQRKYIVFYKTEKCIIIRKQMCMNKKTPQNMFLIYYNRLKTRI